MLKRRSIHAAAALCLFWTSVATAIQPPPPPPATPQDEEAEHQAIRELRALVEQAIRDNRLDLLADALHSDFHGIMLTGRAVNNMSELREYWQGIQALMGEGGRYTTTVNPERSVILGDLALARGTTDDVVVTGDGEEYRFTTMWTAVLQKEGGRWKLRRVQGTIDPIGNPFVREFAGRAIVRYASAAGIGGLALGFGLAVVIRRRRTRVR
jgi:ketosteroid isomerase-like protein